MGCYFVDSLQKRHLRQGVLRRQAQDGRAWQGEEKEEEEQEGVRGVWIGMGTIRYDGSGGDFHGRPVARDQWKVTFCLLIRGSAASSAQTHAVDSPTSRRRLGDDANPPRVQSRGT